MNRLPTVGFGMFGTRIGVGCAASLLSVLLYGHRIEKAQVRSTFDPTALAFSMPMQVVHEQELRRAYSHLCCHPRCIVYPGARPDPRNESARRAGGFSVRWRTGLRAPTSCYRGYGSGSAGSESTFQTDSVDSELCLHASRYVTSLFMIVANNGGYHNS